MSMNPHYQPPKASNWAGRTTQVPKEYWYQAVQLIDYSTVKNDENSTQIGLIGYACEEGVRRNQGRVGAKAGPEAIRQKLGRLAYHHELTISDFGDACCEARDMEAAQSQLAEMVAHLLNKEIFPVVLGGGHDVAYGHFKGISQHLAGSDKRIGIVNFDAHFDLRPIVDQPSSGTPFNQILSECLTADGIYLDN